MNIAIIGCGVAGQAAAIALTRDGHSVTVFERFAKPEPVGAGLLLQPSGLAVLERLGLADAARAWGAPVSGLFGRTARGRTVLDMRYARIFDGAKGLGIHRAALFDVLHEGLNRCGAKLVFGFEVGTIENPNAPEIVSRDGRRAGPFDLVIDCAGAHDRLRTALNVTLRDRIYPWGCLWATCPDRNGEFQGLLRQVYDGTKIMMGILPIGRVPGSTFDGPHVALFWSLRHSDAEVQKQEALAVLKEKMLARWPQAEPVFDEIQSYDALALASYRDVMLRSFSRGHVLMMGDAAHATSPQLGQGANLALIDAITVSWALRQSGDVITALAAYEKSRRAHLNYYQLGSAALTPVFQSNSRAIGWLRDTFLGPAGKLPGIGHVMRTTLSGVRKFPFGLWSMPR